MMQSFPHKGSLWKLYGFTKTHFWGVSIVSHVFIIAGTLLAASSVFAAEALAIRVLLIAICSLLAGCATLLYSILMLFFYHGSSTETDESRAAELKKECR
jgi:cytochrome b subunit of formate dehydrogenase